jgi:hypothetical protein
LNIFRNNITPTDKTEDIVSNQLSQLNDREQYFLGLMKQADKTNRPLEGLLALSYLTQYKNPDIPEIQQQRTLAIFHKLLDSSRNEELKKIREML